MAGRSDRPRDRAGRSREGRPGDRRQDRGLEAGDTRQDRGHEARDTRQDRGHEAGDRRQDRGHEARDTRQDRGHEAGDTRQDRGHEAGDTRQDTRRETARTERERSDRDSRGDRERQHPRDSRAQRQQEEEPVAGPSWQGQGPRQGATQSGQQQSAQTGQRSGKAREERYTTEEKEVLIEEYVHRADRLEGSNLSGSDRQRLWREIMDAVNAVAPVRRSMESVKHRFQDCKRDLKRKLAKEREHASRTGGGPPTYVSFNTWERALRDRIPETSVVGIPGGMEVGGAVQHPYDSASEGSPRREQRQLSPPTAAHTTPATRPRTTPPAAHRLAHSPRSLSLSPQIPGSLSPPPAHVPSTPARRSTPHAAQSPLTQEPLHTTHEQGILDQINNYFTTSRLQQERYQSQMLEGISTIISELRVVQELLRQSMAWNREQQRTTPPTQPTTLPTASPQLPPWLVPSPQPEALPSPPPPLSPHDSSPDVSPMRTRRRTLPPPKKHSQRGKRK